MEKAMNQSSNVVQLEYWTPEDHFTGLCTVAEVGKPKPPIREAMRLAQRATPIAVKALIETATQTDDPAARVKAAMALLDRGWGKAVQAIESRGEVNVTITWATPDRLSYSKGGAEVVDIAPAAELEHGPWKPAEPSKDPEVRFSDAMEALGSKLGPAIGTE